MSKTEILYLILGAQALASRISISTSFAQNSAAKFIKA